jgi:type I restriction enzyme R subunit
MYVDKPLAGVLAVQTLSRLNRAHPQKHDTFVLDFADNAEAVKAAFRTIIALPSRLEKPTPTNCTT